MHHDITPALFFKMGNLLHLLSHVYIFFTGEAIPFLQRESFLKNKDGFKTILYWNEETEKV